EIRKRLGESRQMLPVNGATDAIENTCLGEDEWAARDAADLAAGPRQPSQPRDGPGIVERDRISSGTDQHGAEPYLVGDGMTGRHRQAVRCRNGTGAGRDLEPLV